MLKARRENRNSAKRGLFKVQFSVHKRNTYNTVTNETTVLLNDVSLKLSLVIPHKSRKNES